MPPDDVDFLELIRANVPRTRMIVRKSNTRLRSIGAVAGRGIPLDVTVDGYAELGREKAFTALDR